MNFLNYISKIRSGLLQLQMVKFLPNGGKTFLSIFQLITKSLNDYLVLILSQYLMPSWRSVQPNLLLQVLSIQKLCFHSFLQKSVLHPSGWFVPTEETIHLIHLCSLWCPEKGQLQFYNFIKQAQFCHLIFTQACMKL